MSDLRTAVARLAAVRAGPSGEGGDDGSARGAGTSPQRIAVWTLPWPFTDDITPCAFWDRPGEGPTAYLRTGKPPAAGEPRGRGAPVEEGETSAPTTLSCGFRRR
ncbi:hypothetical protein G9272_42190 [Streptomyces asoensis]|uniref:Uncharacterized protein n=1 Tax=Streptomyces asoensis TaxID=249586 RepID=A0A6M4XDG0_9ACTN|nr:hypothetical protein [Streptomyces asoensis]QJT06123.1 hypothetical protein G9272_42190 [Streptomyces asoensis]